MADKMGLSKIKIFKRSVMRLAASKHIPIFKKRVRRGLDKDGNVFKSYSAKYAKLKGGGFQRTKQKKGGGGGRLKSAQGMSIASKRTHPPDLTLTGEMLRGLRRKKEGKDYYIIGWTGDAGDKAEYNEANDRDIINDIPEKEKKFIANLLEKNLKKQFGKLKNVTIRITV
jgi:hypothetical protein